MSRREIIIIIAIVNVVLLSFLFITAQRLEELPSTILTVKDSIQKSPSPLTNTLTPPPSPQSAAVISDVAVDEVDDVLRDFAAAVAASQQRGATVPAQHSKTPAAPALPAATASLSPSSSQPFHEVVVKRGDFLERIARQQNTTVDAIKLANNLVNDHLKVGQTLRIPTPHLNSTVEDTTLLAAIDKLPTTNSDGNLYRIKSGDSPWKIANQLHVDVEELLRINGLDEASARNLKPGGTIRVP